MSSLSSALRTIKLRDRFIDRSGVIRLSTSFEPITQDVQQEYKVVAEFHSKFLVSENACGSDIEYKIRQAKRHIIHAVFGEFLDSIYRARTALYERDTKKVLTILGELEKEFRGEAP